MNPCFVRTAVGLVSALAVLQSWMGAQESLIPFDAPQVLLPSDSKIDVLLDVDNDGYLEGAGVWRSTQYDRHLDFYWNNRSGGLYLAQRITIPSLATPVFGLEDDAFAAEIDGYPLPDVVVIQDNVLRGYARANEASFYAERWSLADGGSVASVLVRDFDLDGLSDIVTVSSPGGLRFYRGRSNAGPLLTATDLTFASLNGHLIAADVDGAGSLDLAFLRANGIGGVYRVPVLAGGALGAVVLDAVPTYYDQGLVSGDIDGDSDADLVVFRGIPLSLDVTVGSYYVGRRQGPSTFVWEALVSGGPADRLFDIDGDGDLDGLCCSGGGGTPFGNNNAQSMFRVTLNTNGVFGSPRLIPGVGARHFAGAADLDLDGDADLVAGRSVYFARGPWTTPPVKQVGQATGLTPSVIDLADGDGDGDLDIGFGSFVQGSFLKNLGDGTMGAGSVVLPPPPLGSTWLGAGIRVDADGDGDADLLLDASGPIGPAYLLANTGGGAFVTAAIGTSIPTSPMRVGGAISASYYDESVFDVDQDGDQDILVVSTTGGPSELWTNGGGVFTRIQTLAPLTIRSLSDLDGDGDLDILASGGSTFAATFVGYRNLAGTFETTPSMVFGTNVTFQSFFPIACDADGDGDTDIVAPRTSNLGTIVCVSWNAGGGIYSPPIDYPAGPNLNIVFARHFAHDINGDGVQEIISTDATQTVVFRSTVGFVGFVASERMAAGPLALGDMDGDGDPDLVGSAVWTNVVFHGPNSGSRREYGIGVAGSAGITPVIGDVGPFRTGISGAIRVRGGLGGAPGLLILGVAPTDLPIMGVSLLVDPLVLVPFTLSGPVGAPGEGSFDLPWNLPPSLAFTTFYKQCGIADPQAPQGISATSAQRVTLGL